MFGLTKRRAIKNREELITKNEHVTSPVTQNKVVRKAFTMMEDNIKELKLSTRSCEDMERDGSRITHSEIMRTALRAFCELSYEEQYEKVKQNQYSEGK
ncbi:MAG: hypothetical protein CMH25_05335 [Micavibrio sp.]|nr:hypothetical protein [Micavibrio sp.]|tara:strand:+ start:338 stop:634 length:297 start_codon:yes stop_codon:yes gene_type:complete